MRKVAWIALAVVLVAGLAAAGTPRRAGSPLAPSNGVVEVGPLYVPRKADHQDLQNELANLHAWLMAEQVVAGTERPLIVAVTAEELAEVGPERREGSTEVLRRLRIGLVKPVAVGFSFSDIGWGASEMTADGGMVWSAAVQSDGAIGLRLHFEDFRLPAGAELYLFNERGQVVGPYTGAGAHDRGEFWSRMVFGDTVYVQLRHYGPMNAKRARSISFRVTGVGHLSRGLGGREARSLAKSFCSYNANCIENVECVNADPAVDVARDAVAHMQFIDGAYIYACSGGLINNSSGDGTLYFLTANHCLSTDSVASTLETYFKWWIDCGAACPTQWDDPVGVPSAYGATVVATNSTGDYSLLLLDEPPSPGGIAFLGWTTEPVAFANGTDLFRISHPAAAPQAYSEHDVSTSAGTCSSWPRGSWIYSRDTLGATEGGSSGSPVVNGNGQVVGQLSGACGLWPSNPCLSRWNATVDGAFADYFDEVAQWLDPQGGCADADGDGYTDESCGGNDCDDSDPSINPGADEDCDDGIDNDCDGLVDGDDDECTATCDDGDGDGYGQGEGCLGPDCDDTDPAINPGADEVCGDGVDNDCDGQIDEGCCPDADGDGYLDAACGGNDCDDTDPAINPGADEVCGDGVDNDCDGLIDDDDGDCAACLPRWSSCTSNDQCCSNRCLAWGFCW